MPIVYGDGLKPVKYPFPHDAQEKKYYSFVMRPTVWSPVLEVVFEEDVLVPIVTNGFQYECVSSGVTGASEPAFGTVEDEETADNTAVFKAVPINALLNSGDVITQSSWSIQAAGVLWEAAKDMEVGDIIAPTTNNDYRFICTVAGATGGTEPTWDISDDGAITVDNTVSFSAEFVGSLDNAAIVNGTTTRFRLTGVPKDATSISITNSFEVTRANTDVEEFNRTLIIPIKPL